MAEWDPELRRRQAAQDDDALQGGLLAGALSEGVGYGSPGAGWSRWRPLLVPLVVLVVGLLLAFFSPLPGLGVFMVIGAGMATPMVALTVWLH